MKFAFIPLLKVDAYPMAGNKKRNPEEDSFFEKVKDRLFHLARIDCLNHRSFCQRFLPFIEFDLDYNSTGQPG